MRANTSDGPRNRAAVGPYSQPSGEGIGAERGTYPSSAASRHGRHPSRCANGETDPPGSGAFAPRKAFPLCVHWLLRTRLFAAPFALFLLLTSVGIAAADTTPPAETNLSIVVTSATVQVQTGVVTVTGQITCEVALYDLSASVDISKGRVSGAGDDIGLSCAAGETVPFTTSFSADSGLFSPGPVEMGLAAQGVGHGQREGFVNEGPLSIVLEPTR